MLEGSCVPMGASAGTKAMYLDVMTNTMCPWAPVVLIMTSTYMTFVRANVPMGTLCIDYDFLKKQKKTFKNQCFFNIFAFGPHPARIHVDNHP